MDTKDDVQILFDDFAELTKLGWTEREGIAVKVDCDCNGFTSPKNHERHGSKDHSGRSD